MKTLDLTAFNQLAAAWRAANHPAIVETWRQDCGRWNFWVNGHEAIHGFYAHEPTARLHDGIEVALRRGKALNLSEGLTSGSLATFVGAWGQVANSSIVEPAAFGSLLDSPPEAWAVGLVLGSLLIADGDALPAALAPLRAAFERAAGG